VENPVPVRDYIRAALDLEEVNWKEEHGNKDEVRVNEMQETVFCTGTIRVICGCQFLLYRFLGGGIRPSHMCS